MMKKIVLLNGLKSELAHEESIVQKLSDFYQALGWKDKITQENQEEITKGLNILNEDSKRHERILQDLTKYVEASLKDEF